MKKLLLIVCLIIVASFSEAAAQSGMKYPELAKRLEMYFDKELVADVQKQMPQGSDYTIWGWDVGDFSGDGNLDVAMSVRIQSQKGRTMQVFLFVDVDGYLVKVGQFPYEFVELPLEIGVVIRDNACFVTKKRKQFDWTITGYTFDNGSIIYLDQYTTKRVGDLTQETYRNYVTMRGHEKYLQTKNGKQKFYADFMSIPSYSRGRLVYKGYADAMKVNEVDFVPKGAYWWTGEDDLSFSVSSAYDDENLYMTIKVKDDEVVTAACDTCIHDFVDLWIDIGTIDKKRDRFASVKDEKPEFREKAESGLFCFSLHPGDFLDVKPSYKVSSTDDMTATQRIAAKNIKLVTDLKNNGYMFRLKIPFTVFGWDAAPVDTTGITELGCSLLVHDYDNEFRPEEFTEKSNSVFDPRNPSTYGSLMLIPDGEWYGETDNIYREEILKSLLEYGF